MCWPRERLCFEDVRSGGLDEIRKFGSRSKYHTRKGTSPMKEKLFAYLDRLAPQLAEMADTIFDNPELGLEEYKASALLCDFLEKSGFALERGIAGMPTAFRAVFECGASEKKTSIGLLCEYDALAGIGHACAHHMQGPAIVGAAIALKEELSKKGISFKIVVYGTPAEETSGGKIQMLEQGYFQDIDVALMMHGSPTTTTDVRSLALSSFTVRFHGTSAHAALMPEAGRSALDGLILLFQGIEFMREHIPDDVRIHYVVTQGGGVSNVVPKLAEGKFTLRSYSRSTLDGVVARFRKIVQGAALMTETEYDIIEDKALHNKIPVLKLNEILMANARLVGAPAIRPPREKTGSTDFGNVMYHLPGSCIRLAFVPEGTSSHSEGFIAAGKSQAAHDAVLYAAKILAASACDLIEDSALLEDIHREFEENKRKDGQL